MAWVVLALALALLLPAIVLVWRRPALALYAFVVGLVLHNAVFMLLFTAGARGWQLTVAQAWKETLLAAAIARISWDVLRTRTLPFRARPVDLAALAFAAVVVLYALIPQDVLEGAAGARAELHGMRHHLLPVAAFFVGRALPLARDEARRLVAVALGVAVVAAVAGIAEEYLVSLESWRDLGAAGYFTQQLGFPVGHGPGGVPANWVLNTSEGLFRRLISFFLSPLGAAYLFVPVLCLAAAGLVSTARRGLVAGASALVFAGLLFSFTRSAVLALVGGLLVLAAALRGAYPAALAAGALAAAIGFAALFPSIAPTARFFPEDLPLQAELGRQGGPLPEGDPLTTSVRLSDPSSRQHLRALEEGARNLVSHPQGYGVGNSGQAAQRFGVPLRAGESVYFELGADLGVAGLALWLLFSALVLLALVRRARDGADTFDRRFAAGVLAAAAALFAIALISDVWGNPWPTYVVWWLAGAAVTAAALEPAAAAEPRTAPRARDPVHV